jgi:predicted Zn-dependent peptidase
VTRRPASRHFVIATLLLAAAPAARVDANATLPGRPSMQTHASPDRTSPPKLPSAPSIRLPRMQTHRLPNGLQLSVVEIHKAPVVDATLIIGAGAVRDPDDLPGLATFTANMLDEGAGSRTSLQISDEIDFLGASLSTGAGLEAAQVNLHVPRRGFEQGLELMSDIALRPTFPDSEIARQRELRHSQLLQLRDQPTNIAPIAFNSVLFGHDHPYGRPAGGNDASTQRLDRARVTSFYSQYYRPGNATVLVVGDITMAEARRLIEARFGPWSGSDVTVPSTPPAPPATARGFYLVDKPDAAQSVIRIGNVGVARATPDYYALQVLNTVLGGSFTSRLNQNLREAHGYTYGASSTFEMRRLAGPFRAGASVATAKTDSAVIEFMKELRRVRDEAVPEAELKKAKQYLTLGLAGDFEGTAQAGQRFADLIVNGLPADTWDHYSSGIEAVSSADVQRVARKYVDTDHFVMLIVGDLKQIEPGLQALNEGAVSHRDLWGQAPSP